MWSRICVDRLTYRQSKISKDEVMGPLNLTKKAATMLKRFFMAQWKYPSQGDWTEQIMLDLDEFNISREKEEIESYSTYSFKRQERLHSPNL